MAQRLSREMLDKHDKRTIALVKKVINTTDSKIEMAKAAAWCAAWGEYGMFHELERRLWKFGKSVGSLDGYLPKNWRD